MYSTIKLVLQPPWDREDHLNSECLRKLHTKKLPWAVTAQDPGILQTGASEVLPELVLGFYQPSKEKHLLPVAQDARGTTKNKASTSQTLLAIQTLSYTHHVHLNTP